MFKSNIRMIMEEKKITMREMTALTGLSSRTLTKARSDAEISECRLSTLARIAAALGVKTKRLFEEVAENDTA